MEQRSRLNNFGVLTKRELSSSLIGPQCHDIIHDTFLLRQCSNVRKFTVLNHTSDDKRFFEKCSVNYSQLSVSHLESLVLVWFAFHPTSVAARVCHSQAWWRSESDVGLVRKKPKTKKRASMFVKTKRWPTLVFRPSAVVSSNSSSSLNLISVVLKVLSDFIETTPASSTLITRLGLAMLPICRVAKPTPSTQWGMTLMLQL